MGGGAAEPATGSSRRPQARLLTSNSYGRPLESSLGEFAQPSRHRFPLKIKNVISEE
jgi:hypothetical protein